MLLDIGAVWCHWCHVMDRESYEDEEVAAIINDQFIAVKVDRDERPEIDRRYQSAVGAITGQGGWPLTAFLTERGQVFYGGTYFPKNDMHGRPGYKSLADTGQRTLPGQQGIGAGERPENKGTPGQADHAGRGGPRAPSLRVRRCAGIHRAGFRPRARWLRPRPRNSPTPQPSSWPLAAITRPGKTG